MLNNSYIYGINSRWYSDNINIEMDLEERVKFTIMTKISKKIL